MYKMPLFVERGDGDEKMDMANVTPLWEETMAKTWQQFLGLYSWTVQSIEQKQLKGMAF